MNEISTIVYLMNPAEDEIKFGSDLAEGMWVLPEQPDARHPRTDTEDARLRAQRFRRVTRLTLTPNTHYAGGVKIQFIGEWVDGYQETYTGTAENAWLVKKENKSPAA